MKQLMTCPIEDYLAKLTDDEKTNPLTLAFDIETDGAFSSKNNILQIGASVVSAYPRRKQIDSFLMSEYRKTELGEHNIEQFEPRCWNEFWSKNTTTLDAIAAHTNTENSIEYNRTEMITGFVSFVSKWENICSENNLTLFRTTDNKAYDPFFINVYIERYLPKTPVLPYKFSNGSYSNLFETHSVQWGLLLALDGKVFKDKKRGLAKAILDYYDCLPSVEEIVHDHRADHDAYAIAEELQILLAIAREDIKKKVQ